MSTQRAKHNVKHRPSFPEMPFEERFVKSRTTKIKKRALMELENPDVIVMLGGEPQYIHSTEAYFRQGLKTAYNTMLRYVYNLADAQQRKIKQAINIINNRWQGILHKAFGNEITTFSAFQNFWENNITKNSNPNEFMNRLASLIKLKEAKTKLAMIKSIKEQAIASMKGKARSQANAEALQDKLFTLGIQVGTSKNNKHFTYSKSSIEQQWEQIIIESTKNVVNNIDDKLLQLVNNNISNQITALKEGKETNIDHTLIGFLFEYMSDGIYEGIIKHPNTDKLIDLVISGVQAENDSTKSSIKHKEDSKIELKVGTEVILSFMTSDKTGQSIGFIKNENNKSIADLAGQTIDQFTAGLQSNTLDFSELELGIANYDKNAKQINGLINYVMANGYAFSGRVSVLHFKELIVLYIAWLKIISEVIGDTNIEDTPLAVRTMKTLYNTADILNIFSNLDVKEISDYVNKTYLDNFYKAFPALPNNMKNNLFISKKIALEQLGSSVSYKNLKNYNETIEKNGIAFPSVASRLEEIYKNFIQIKPSIKTNFLIKLNNLTSTF